LESGKQKPKGATMPKMRLKQGAERAVRTREELEQLVGEIASQTIQRDGLKVRMDAELTELRARYAEPLAQLDLQIEAGLTVAKNWAEEHQAEFAGKKSLDLTHGIIGFRTGQPQLKRLAGWTWDRVLEAVTRLLPDYVRHKHETDRERLLADRETLAPMFREIGVKVEQDESFFLEPKRETLTEEQLKN
jgi:phage host-nuclease inhibitor protein Gam